MIVGERLRDLREQKRLMQSDIAERTGLLPGYISRVENCHTTPSIATLEKWAKGLGISLYQLLYDGEAPPKPDPIMANSENEGWGRRTSEAKYLRKLIQALARMSDRDRDALLGLTEKLAGKPQGKK
jgi:transcriptional regulator with XRE-family HTH domain